MKYQIDHDYHIHSKLSICSADPKQSTENILAFAESTGYRDICLTDHFWDEAIDNRGWDFYMTQDFAHISKSLPLPQSEKVRFHFGGETDMMYDPVLGITPETMDKCEFVIIPTTHFHMDGYVIPEDFGVEKRAEYWVKNFEAILNMDLPFEKIGIAHLACGLMHSCDERASEKVLRLVPDGELERLFTKAAQLGVGIEINSDDFDFEKHGDARKEQVLRVFGKAKACGCKFYLGSDAHHPRDLEHSIGVFEKAVELLNLTEDDKFRFCK